MIASGLCLMGGCFSLDSAGAAVDSYWRSSYVSIPQIRGTDIISAPFPGGSSGSDEFWGAGNFDWSDEFTEYQFSLGVSSYYNAGKYTGACGLRDANNSRGNLYFNNSELFIPSGRYVFYAKNGQVEAISSDSRYTVTAPAFSLTMQQERKIRIRHWKIQELEYLQYINVETMVKWQVVPMRGVSGNAAIWETWTRTLTEL